MYKDHSQLTIEDFIFPFGALDPNNRWVRMASFVPWDEIEKPYAKSFGTTGAPAHPARMAFGALLLKQCLSVSDAELVNQIAENPYLQFFIGCKSFDKGCPFGASTLVAFRKRFPEDEVRRIVSIEQPWVRPVVRGKTHANTEFGEKLHLCIEDGFSRVDYASFEAYNEASRLTDAAKGYKMRHGAYPKRILADKIYTTRANRAWCKARGIELSGPKLGRPSKDPQVAREDCRRERESASDRNCVEGAFGTMKHSYGMDRVMTRLKETTETVVAMAVLCFNLKKLEGLSYTFIRWALKMLQSWPLLLVGDRGLQRA